MKSKSRKKSMPPGLMLHQQLARGMELKGHKPMIAKKEMEKKKKEMMS